MLYVLLRLLVISTHRAVVSVHTFAQGGVFCAEVGALGLHLSRRQPTAKWCTLAVPSLPESTAKARTGQL